MNSQAHIARLAQAARLPLASEPLRIAILTGQSMLDRSPLSHVQADFLDAVAPAGWSAMRRGFPYDGEGGPAAPAPFAQAAANSIGQFVWASVLPGYGAAAGLALQRLCAATTGRLVLLAGSAGLAIFNAAEPHLREGCATSVIGLGATGRRPMRARYVGIRARRDRWSRLLGPAPDFEVDGDHYGYWASGEVRRIVAGLLAEADR